MIKVAIKHYIYDYCIDLVFSGIKNNFMKIPIEKIKVGDKYQLIVEQIGETLYYHYDCVIIEIDNSRFGVYYEKFEVYEKDGTLCRCRYNEITYCKLECITKMVR